MPYYTQKEPTGDEMITVSTVAIGPTLSKLKLGSGDSPLTANNALFRVETNDVRWRDTGTAPTSSVGTLLKAGESMVYDGPVNKIQFIRVSADATVSAAYYRVG